MSMPVLSLCDEDEARKVLRVVLISEDCLKSRARFISIYIHILNGVL